MTAPSSDIRAASPDTSVAAPPAATGWVRALWNTVVAGIAVIMGILPHVLHHIGLLAGTALIAGAGGTVLFGVLGLAASVPFLIKLYRRFGTWVAPAVALGVFTVMFAISAFVIGPAINGADSSTPGPAPAPATATAPATAPTVDHGSHHQ